VSQLATIRRRRVDNTWSVAALTARHEARYWPRIAISAYPTCIQHPRLGGPRRNIAIMFGVEKLEWWGYATVKKIWRHVYSSWHITTKRLSLNFQNTVVWDPFIIFSRCQHPAMCRWARFAVPREPLDYLGFVICCYNWNCYRTIGHNCDWCIHGWHTTITGRRQSYCISNRLKNAVIIDGRFHRRFQPQFPDGHIRLSMWVIGRSGHLRSSEMIIYRIVVINMLLVASLPVYCMRFLSQYIGCSYTKQPAWTWSDFFLFCSIIT